MLQSELLSFKFALLLSRGVGIGALNLARMRQEQDVFYTKELATP